MLEDGAFIDQEVRRFQTLIHEAGRRFGGAEERYDIWGDEAFVAKSSAGVGKGQGRSGGGGRGGGAGSGSGAGPGSPAPSKRQKQSTLGWTKK
jgi:hypothetical protein